MDKPSTILAKILVQNVTSLQLEKSPQNGYSYDEQKVTYAEIEQRWLMVESAERKKSDLDKLSGNAVATTRMVLFQYPAALSN